MKKFLLTLTAIFICTVTFAKTINWHVGDTVYQTTTCESGSSITPPTPPVKPGYTFVGWKEYIPIEYLESTGTQWIDTGVVGNLNTRLIVDFMSIIPSSIYGSSIVGGFLGDNTNSISLILTLGNSRQRTCRFGDMALEKFPQNVVFNRTRYVVSTDKNALKINDRTIHNFNTTVPFITNGTLLLFGLNMASGETGGIRIYSSQLYDNDTLVRDFIPVLDANGTPCMYDKVERKFYYNAGTGDFIAGPVIGE